MKVDAKAILDKYRAEKANDRGRVTVYLSKGLYKAFKKACDDIPASTVLEDLMRAFVESASKR